MSTSIEKSIEFAKALYLRQFGDETGNPLKTEKLPGGYLEETYRFSMDGFTYDDFPAMSTEDQEEVVHFG